MEANEQMPPLMPKQVSAMPTAIKWGIFMGLAQIIFTLLMYMTGQMQEGGGFFGLLIYPVVFVIALLGVQSFRNKEKEGFISFGEAFKTSFLIIVFATIIASIFSFIFFTFIVPDFFDEMTRLQEEKMIEQGLSDQEIERAMGFAKMFTSGPLFVVIGLICSLFTGAIISLIVAAIAKKDKPFQFPPQ